MRAVHIGVEFVWTDIHDRAHMTMIGTEKKQQQSYKLRIYFFIKQSLNTYIQNQNWFYFS